jgi:hypothetical protein
MWESKFKLAFVALQTFVTKVIGGRKSRTEVTIMRASRKLVAGLAAGLLCCGVAQAQGLEPLKLYDDFNADSLDPLRWFGAEQVRVIKGNKLNLMQRNWPSATSNFGATPFSYNEGFRNPEAITAIKAKVTVNALEVSSCAANATVGESRVRLSGAFFNVGTASPPSAVNDMIAQIRVIRRSDSTDAARVLRVEGVVTQCTNSDCSMGVDIGSIVELGTVHIGAPVTLEMQWDAPNDRFLFSRDDGKMTGSVVYGAFQNALTGEPIQDSSPPGSPNKSLSTRMFLPNCSSGPRISGMVDASFDNVFVNNSYPLP